MRYPTDKLDQKLARLMTGNNHYRDRLKDSVYLSGDPKQPVDRMEHALQLIIKTEGLSKKTSDLKRYSFPTLKAKLQEKVAKKELSKEEMNDLLAVEEARWDAILVDEFTFDSMKKKTFNSVTDSIKSPLR
jgi:acyl-CoA dehydrogenase